MTPTSTAWLDDLTTYAPTNAGPLPGMTRGGKYVLLEDVRAALAVQVAPAEPVWRSHDANSGMRFPEAGDLTGGATDAAATSLEPTTHELIVALRDKLGLFSGAMPISPKQAWEEALALVAATSLEPADHFREALRMSWEGADPLHPPGPPGSYSRGQWQGYIDGLTTLRANFNLLSDRAALAAAPSPAPSPALPAPVGGPQLSTDERAAFKAWWDSCPLRRTFHAGHSEWMTWQAARAELASRSPAVADGAE